MCFKNAMRFTLINVLAVVMLSSCASKKEILYFQDAESLYNTALKFSTNTLQPNDIISVRIESSIIEAAQPYNSITNQGNANINNPEALKLQGYLVREDHTVILPVLGSVNVKDKTPSMLEAHIVSILVEGKHLKDPTVSVRVVNAKVTILGEVRNPGTFTYTEQTITLPQALGLAGDLTINAVRDDVLVIREVDGVLTTAHIDMTKTDWFQSPYYRIKQNDVIVVNPNNPKVKTAGFIGNIGTLLSVTSVLLSSIILITR